ncbi:MAG: hypothetical protein ACYC7L_06215 [Nitrospirota bacterium]
MNPLYSLKMLDWKIYNSLPEEQVQKLMNPLKTAISGCKGIVLDDASAFLAGHIAAVSAGMTESMVTIVKEAGPGTSKKDFDHGSPAVKTAELAITVRVNEIVFVGIAKGIEQKEGEKTPEERTSDGIPFVRVESDPPVTIGLSGEITVVRISDGKELLKQPLLTFIPPRRMSAWARDPMAAKQEIAGVLQRFSRTAAEYIFQVHDLKPISSGESMVYCVMALREPNMNPPPTSQSKRKEYSRAEFGATGTLQPTLKWEAFPRYKDREEGPKGFADKISDVTYDLKVWKGQESSPPVLVYERTGVKAKESWNEHRTRPMRQTDMGGIEELPEITRREGTAEHTIEGPLDPASDYYWTVRARFKLDGKTRLTPWSHFSWPNVLVCTGRELQDGLNYRFRTPPGPAAK